MPVKAEPVPYHSTLLQINMEVERVHKTTILYIGPSMNFHVNLGEDNSNDYCYYQFFSSIVQYRQGSHVYDVFCHVFAGLARGWPSIPKHV